ncbi:MAG TPA: response regulator [Sphingomicrobium sp.]|nr:response regulator [Sphingomicrobium sp.]
MSASRSILVVEDEPLIAMMLEDFLETLGHKVHASCESVEDAVAAADKGGFDVAIIDINLNGETAWPVARKLREKEIPFVIATGGHVEPPPPEFKNVPVIEKPYTVDRVSPALEQAIGS